jgi:aminoglycoside 9-adenylyltransferase
MSTLLEIVIPLEATKAVSIVEELLGSTLVGMYLFGSAVVGGLRDDSDVDVLVITDRRMSAATRRELVARLMKISGRVGNTSLVRPLEFTVVNLADVVPWRYPPRSELVYGEWLREEFEDNRIPDSKVDPDLAIVLIKVRQSSIPILGPDARQILDSIPTNDLYLALKESLPNLVGELEGDERNVLLTLARMWMTATTGKIVPKDTAATWAIDRLPRSLGSTLNLAREAYIGEVMDNWTDKGSEVALLVDYMRQSIEASLGQTDFHKP